MKQKISICIPTYNRRKYLKETIESVLAQTYKDYEIVIVDDGSTDGTEQVLKEAGYPVRYYWQQNSGDAAARNKLVELAQGQYIAFLDSDDLLIPDAIERMTRAVAAESKEVIVYGPYLRIDENGQVFGKCKRKLYSGNITGRLFQDILIHSCGSMLPKRTLEEAGGFDTSLPVCSDYDLWLRLSLKYRFIALPEPTFKRRRHSGNLSLRSTQNRITELKVLERFYYERGGNATVPKRIAMRRLSKEGYRAGVCAIQDGQLRTAQKLLRIALRRHPNVKTLVRWAQAVLRNGL